MTSQTPPTYLGRTVRYIRERLGLSREAMADRLNVPVAELASIEDNVAPTPKDLAERFRLVYDLDLYPAAWCLFGDNSKIPEAIRGPAAALAADWDLRLTRFFEDHAPGMGGMG